MKKSILGVENTAEVRLILDKEFRSLGRTSKSILSKRRARNLRAGAKRIKGRRILCVVPEENLIRSAIITLYNSEIRDIERFVSYSSHRQKERH